MQCQRWLERATVKWVKGGLSSLFRLSVLGVLLERWAMLTGSRKEGQLGVACTVLLALSCSSYPHPPPVPIPAGIQPLRPWLCQQLVFNNLCAAGTQVSWQTRGLSSMAPGTGRVV